MRPHIHLLNSLIHFCIFAQKQINMPKLKRPIKGDHSHNKRALRADLFIFQLSIFIPPFHLVKTPYIWDLSSSSPLWLRLLSVTDIGNKKCQYLTVCACATAVLSNFYPVKLPLNHKDTSTCLSRKLSDFRA